MTWRRVVFVGFFSLWSLVLMRPTFAQTTTTVDPASTSTTALATTTTTEAPGTGASTAPASEATLQKTDQDVVLGLGLLVFLLAFFVVSRIGLE